MELVGLFANYTFFLSLYCSLSFYLDSVEFQNKQILLLANNTLLSWYCKVILNLNSVKLGNFYYMEKTILVGLFSEWALQ